MARFKDRHGREWEIGFTLGNLPRVRDAGFSVSVAAKDSNEFDKLSDPDAFGRVMWTLCGSQAERQGVTQDEFADGFDGPTISAALDCVMEAIADFSHRPAVAEAIRKKLPGERARVEREIVSRLEAVPTLPLTTSPTTGSRSEGGNSPGSSGSTPAN